MGDNDEIAFRNYLNSNPDVAKEYEKLKLSLLPKYRNDRDGYTESKSEFVKGIIRETKVIKKGCWRWTYVMSDPIAIIIKPGI